jgi:hypothetical protein
LKEGGGAVTQPNTGWATRALGQEIGPMWTQICVPLVRMTRVTYKSDVIWPRQRKFASQKRANRNKTAGPKPLLHSVAK